MSLINEWATQFGGGEGNISGYTVKLSASLPATEMENTKSIELKYQFMLEYPLSVPEYEIERKKFFSMNPGKDTKQKWNAYWVDLVGKWKQQEEKELIKRKLYAKEEKSVRFSSPPVAWVKQPKAEEPSSKCQTEAELHERYYKVMNGIKKTLKATFEGFLVKPTTHRDYNKYRDRFLKVFAAGNTSSFVEELEWKLFWERKMSDLFKSEMRSREYDVWNAIKSQNDRLEKQNNLRTKMLAVSEQRDRIDSLARLKQTIALTELPAILRNYDKKVLEMETKIRDKFSTYIDFRNYKHIKREKEMFLEKMCPTQNLTLPIVLEFEQRFKEYWVERLEILLKEKLESKKTKIRLKCKDLLPGSDYEENGEKKRPKVPKCYRKHRSTSDTD